MKSALIFGGSGQDSSYLAELLLSKNYQVHSVVRRSSCNNLCRIEHLLGNPNFNIIRGDITDPHSVRSIFSSLPNLDEVYNLAAMSEVGTSFSMPQYCMEVNLHGHINVLESFREFALGAKLYFAGSSEQWGNNKDVDGFQRDTTAFAPVSPYAVSKVAAFEMTKLFRESYDLFCCSGLLHNHESERRGEYFVTRKITKYIGKLVKSKFDPQMPKLKLGNLSSYRDFGYSPDYVVAMHLMLQQDVPKDYVIATGEAHTIEDFVKEAFLTVGKNYRDHIEIDPSLYRPGEVNYLRGDASLARKELGWSPTISFLTLVRRMVSNDIAMA